MHRHHRTVMGSALLLLVASCPTPHATLKDPSMPPRAQPPRLLLPVDDPEIARLERELAARLSESSAKRLRVGLRQVAGRWRETDGSATDLARFVQTHLITDEAVLADTVRHLEYALEMLDGHANEVARELSRFQVLDEGPARPVDGLLAAYSPKAHILEDLFQSKIAFVALLNFPLTTLEQRLQQGQRWAREDWARARLAGRFEHRVPAEVVQEIDRVAAAAERYIDGYNVLMDHIVLEDGSRPFAAGLKLISHWGLRDEIRAQYDAPDGRGLARQRLIARVMERIIEQQIPEASIDKGDLEWDPEHNRVRSSGQAWRDAQREPDTRYQHLLRVFLAHRRLDPYFPDAPTHMDRVFAIERELPERKVRELLESVLTSDVARATAETLRQRLGRPLEPFDLWYAGFRPKGTMGQDELDRITRTRYPDGKAFERDMPRLLGQLGFSADTAADLSRRIVVDSARGAGHAYGPKRRDDLAHLRTRIGPDGMSYKGYNIAIHELGHNVEQVISMSRIDHTLLEGVPNTGFTEAFAFLFQARDLDLLGVAASDAKAEALRTLDRFWSVFEISGVALLDMDLWHWMYDHPQASPADVRRAAVELAQKIWNRYYAPVFGTKDAVLLAIYSHIIAYGLYTPDYPLGMLITFQVEQHMRGRSLGTEMERMCRLGRLTPDAWMRQAVGGELSARPLIEAAGTALEQLSGR